MKLQTLSLLLAGFALQAQANTMSRFPYKLVCDFESVEQSPHGELEKQILYTRLMKVDPLSLTKEWVEVLGSNDRVWKQEVALAPWSGGNYGASVNKDEYHYDVWSCDTEDRWYAFKTSDLELSLDSEETRIPVWGKVTVDVREPVGTFNLKCTAFYTKLRK